MAKIVTCYFLARTSYSFRSVISVALEPLENKNYAKKIC